MLFTAPELVEPGLKSRRVLQSLRGLCRALASETQSLGWAALPQKASGGHITTFREVGDSIELLLTVAKQSFISRQGIPTLAVRA